MELNSNLLPEYWPSDSNIYHSTFSSTPNSQTGGPNDPAFFHEYVESVGQIRVKNWIALHSTLCKTWILSSFEYIYFPYKIKKFVEKEKQKQGQLFKFLIN